MLGVNAKLNSYTASVKVDVNMKTFPFLSPTLEGNLYHKKPDREAIVFQTYPALASAFKKVYPRIEAPARWNALYVVTQGTDTNGATSFKLVPRKHGRIDHIDVKVDDATATVAAMTWFYNDDPGTISFTAQYADINGNYLIKSQTGKVDLEKYKADVKSEFSDFKINVAINDSVFAP